MSTAASIDWSKLPPPQPLPDLDAAGFWQATAEGHLQLCRCQSCAWWHSPPLERCRMCAEPTAYETVAGTGTIYTFIVQRQPAVVGFFDQVPYAVALVELDEQPGLRLPGLVVDTDPDDVAIGMRVEVDLRPLAGGDFSVAVWRPVRP